MYKLTAHIIIKTATKTWNIHKITSCEIERDIENITATCVVVLPRKTKWHNETGIPIKRGDKITVKLGYDDNFETAFTGYIRSVGTKTPLEITCEDEMYLLKNTAATKKSYPEADLETLLKEQLPSDIKFNIFGEQKFGKWIVNCDTVSQLLGELRENGFLFYFKDGDLNAGAIFDSKSKGKKQVFREGKNIIDSSDLEWYNPDDISLRIKACGTDANGYKMEIEVGDKDGELRSFFKYNTTKQALETEANAKLIEWKVGGLTGSFTTFGAKLVWLLDTIKVQLENCEIGDYKVRKNNITFGTDGYRQNITIQGKE